SPEAWAVYVDLHRRMTPGEKIARVFTMTEMVNALCESGLRERFPNASDREIFLRRARLTLGEQLFEKVYGAEFAGLT
ncbi:MAG TPA: hypothetical protein VHW24_11290, partial [Bryobacteraceae bacterium]|nr:hypothetical protein [Bryobacteraceae bacterium]